MFGKENPIARQATLTASERVRRCVPPGIKRSVEKLPNHCRSRCTIWFLRAGKRTWFQSASPPFHKIRHAILLNCSRCVVGVPQLAYEEIEAMHASSPERCRWRTASGDASRAATFHSILTS